MNVLSGRISHIESSDAILLVEVRVGDVLCTALVIDTPETSSFLHTNNTIELLIKETEVALGKQPLGNLSIRNQFPCRVQSIERGKILTEARLDFSGHSLTSIVTTRSANALNLQIEDEVVALVKSTEVSLRPASRS